MENYNLKELNVRKNHTYKIFQEQEINSRKIYDTLLSITSVKEDYIEEFQKKNAKIEINENIDSEAKYPEIFSEKSKRKKKMSNLVQKMNSWRTSIENVEAELESESNQHRITKTKNRELKKRIKKLFVENELLKRDKKDMIEKISEWQNLIMKKDKSLIRTLKREDIHVKKLREKLVMYQIEEERKSLSIQNLFENCMDMDVKDFYEVYQTNLKHLEIEKKIFSEIQNNREAQKAQNFDLWEEIEKRYESFMTTDHIKDERNIKVKQSELISYAKKFFGADNEIEFDMQDDEEEELRVLDENFVDTWLHFYEKRHKMIVSASELDLFSSKKNIDNRSLEDVAEEINALDTMINNCKKDIIKSNIKKKKAQATKNSTVKELASISKKRKKRREKYSIQKEEVDSFQSQVLESIIHDETETITKLENEEKDNEHNIKELSKRKQKLLDRKLEIEKEIEEEQQEYEEEQKKLSKANKNDPNTQDRKNLPSNDHQTSNFLKLKESLDRKTRRIKLSKSSPAVRNSLRSEPDSYAKEFSSFLNDLNGKIESNEQKEEKKDKSKSKEKDNEDNSVDIKKKNIGLIKQFYNVREKRTKDLENEAETITTIKRNEMIDKLEGQLENQQKFIEDFKKTKAEDWTKAKHEEAIQLFSMADLMKFETDTNTVGVQTKIPKLNVGAQVKLSGISVSCQTKKKKKKKITNSSNDFSTTTSNQDTVFSFLPDEVESDEDKDEESEENKENEAKEEKVKKDVKNNLSSSLERILETGKENEVEIEKSPTTVRTRNVNKFYGLSFNQVKPTKMSAASIIKELNIFVPNKEQNIETEQTSNNKKERFTQSKDTQFKESSIKNDIDNTGEVNSYRDNERGISPSPQEHKMIHRDEPVNQNQKEKVENYETNNNIKEKEEEIKQDQSKGIPSTIVPKVFGKKKEKKKPKYETGKITLPKKESKMKVVKSVEMGTQWIDNDIEESKNRNNLKDLGIGDDTLNELSSDEENEGKNHRVVSIFSILKNSKVKTRNFATQVTPRPTTSYIDIRIIEKNSQKKRKPLSNDEIQQMIEDAKIQKEQSVLYWKKKFDVLEKEVRNKRINKDEEEDDEDEETNKQEEDGDGIREKIEKEFLIIETGTQCNLLKPTSKSKLPEELKLEKKINKANPNHVEKLEQLSKVTEEEMKKYSLPFKEKPDPKKVLKKHVNRTHSLELRKQMEINKRLSYEIELLKRRRRKPKRRHSEAEIPEVSKNKKIKKIGSGIPTRKTRRKSVVFKENEIYSNEGLTNQFKKKKNVPKTEKSEEESPATREEKKETIDLFSPEKKEKKNEDKEESTQNKEKRNEKKKPKIIKKEREEGKDTKKKEKTPKKEKRKNSTIKKRNNSIILKNISSTSTKKEQEVIFEEENIGVNTVEEIEEEEIKPAEEKEKKEIIKKEIVIVRTPMKDNSKKKEEKQIGRYYSPRLPHNSFQKRKKRKRNKTIGCQTNANTRTCSSQYDKKVYSIDNGVQVNNSKVTFGFLEDIPNKVKIVKSTIESEMQTEDVDVRDIIKPVTTEIQTIQTGLNRRLETDMQTEELETHESNIQTDKTIMKSKKIQFRSKMISSRIQTDDGWASNLIYQKEKEIEKIQKSNKSFQERELKIERESHSMIKKLQIDLSRRIQTMNEMKFKHKKQISIISEEYIIQLDNATEKINELKKHLKFERQEKEKLEKDQKRLNSINSIKLKKLEDSFQKRLKSTKNAIDHDLKLKEQGIKQLELMYNEKIKKQTKMNTQNLLKKDKLLKIIQQKFLKEIGELDYNFKNEQKKLNKKKREIAEMFEKLQKKERKITELRNQIDSMKVYHQKTVSELESIKGKIKFNQKWKRNQGGINVQEKENDDAEETWKQNHLLLEKEKRITKIKEKLNEEIFKYNLDIEELKETIRLDSKKMVALKLEMKNKEQVFINKEKEKEKIVIQLQNELRIYKDAINQKNKEIEQLRKSKFAKERVSNTGHHSKILSKLRKTSDRNVPKSVFSQSMYLKPSTKSKTTIDYFDDPLEFEESSQIYSSSPFHTDGKNDEFERPRSIMTPLKRKTTINHSSFFKPRRRSTTSKGTSTLNQSLPHIHKNSNTQKKYATVEPNRRKPKKKDFKFSSIKINL